MKLLPRAGQINKVSRPFTGAWIETSAAAGARPCADGRPFTGAWIETDALGSIADLGVRSPLHGGVD